MGNDLTMDEMDAPTGPQETVTPEPTGSRTVTALVSAVISAVITGVVTGLLSFPTTCDTTFAPFMSDCRNVVGWAAFADYPGNAAVITGIAAAAAGVLVYLMVRFSDS